MRRHFGFDSFRAGQQKIVHTLLCGEDCVGVLPTGGGKSLCYQLPALARPGLTLVVSPLIALMKDQVDSLLARGIPATFVNSSLPWAEIQQRLMQMGRGAYRLVYVAPERFRSEPFIRTLGGLTVGLFAVDEAHCLSMWGHDFRPDYLRLREVLRTLGHPQTVALTATATPEVQHDIVALLGLGESPRGKPTIAVGGFARPNLTLAVHRVRCHEEKLARCHEILRRCPTGIVYCSTRVSVARVGERLARAGISCVRYHGGMDDDARKQAQDDFVSGRVPVAVATNAFGMGIDRADLRCVVHWDVPGSLEACYQEAGRAGRDGGEAHCEILFCHADVRTQRFFMEGANPSPSLVHSITGHIRELAATGTFRIGTPALLSRLRPGINRMAVESALGHLERAGFLLRGPDGFLTLTDGGAELGAVFDLLRGKAHRDRTRLHRLLTYVDHHGCRHAFILRYFGDPAQASFRSCAHCDNCLHRPRPVADALHLPSAEERLLIQKVLRCVAHLDGRFGRARVALVLAGSRDRDLLQAGLQRIPEYGALRGFRQDSIRDLVEALLEEGCLKSVGAEYPTLRVAPHGQAVLLGRAPLAHPLPRLIDGRAEPQRAVVFTVPRNTGASFARLANALRDLRRRLARERAVPPYRILHDRTLEEIARTVPRDEPSLLSVKGIGPAKLDDLGAEILNLTRAHVANRP